MNGSNILPEIFLMRVITEIPTQLNVCLRGFSSIAIKTSVKKQKQRNILTCRNQLRHLLPIGLDNVGIEIVFF